MAIITINTTGDIPSEHVFEALDGLRESSELGDFVRVEWPHRGGWVQFDSIERIQVHEITGAIHVTARVHDAPLFGNLYGPGDRFTGWIDLDRGDKVSIWQTFEVNASNFESVF